MKYRFTLFDRLILLAPFLIPFAVCVGVAVGLIAPNGLLDPRFASILSIVFAVYMLIMLWRTSSSFGSPPAQNETGTTSITRKILLLIVLTLIGAAVAYLLLGVQR